MVQWSFLPAAALRTSRLSLRPNPPRRAMSCLKPFVLYAATICAVGAVTKALAEEAAKKLPPPASRQVDFAADIQPLFQKNCFSCHGAEHQEGGLRLDQKKRALEGGDSG